MAGSRQKFVYFTDAPNSTGGATFLILNLDESNTLLLGGQRATATVVGALIGAGASLLDRDQADRLRPRTIDFEAIVNGRTIRRRLVCPDPGQDIWRVGGQIQLPVLTGATNNAATMASFTAVLATGEQRSFFRYADGDTGLDDGTQP